MSWQLVAAGSVDVTSQVSGPLVVVPAGVVEVTWIPAAWACEAPARTIAAAPAVGSIQRDTRRPKVAPCPACAEIPTTAARIDSSRASLDSALRGISPRLVDPPLCRDHARVGLTSADGAPFVHDRRLSWRVGV